MPGPARAGRRRVEAAATPGRSRRSLQTKDPCGRGRHSSRPRPRRSLPFLPLPASWAAPPSSEERSLLRESSPALSPLSLSLQQVWAPGRQTGAGRPSPGFLGSAPLPLGVRAFCCFYLGSGATRPPFQSSLRASPALPPSPLPACPAALALALRARMMCALEGPSSSCAWGVLPVFS